MRKDRFSTSAQTRLICSVGMWRSCRRLASWISSTVRRCIHPTAGLDASYLITDDDRKTFSNHFNNSLSSQQDLSCYTRIKCKPDSLAVEQVGTHNELLFEIRGHALYLPNDSEFKCFFFMAKPYPSRNMAMYVLFKYSINFISCICSQNYE